MKLAIVIEGQQNSGKTTTIREVNNVYGSHAVRIMRAGWKTISLNRAFRALNVWTLLIPASPSETKKPLSERLGSHLPEVIIMAEQSDGNLRTDTYDFLKINGYKIRVKTLSNTIGTGVWDKFDASTASVKLSDRADEIIDEIKKFVVSNSLV